MNVGESYLCGEQDFLTSANAAEPVGTFPGQGFSLHHVLCKSLPFAWNALDAILQLFSESAC